MSKRNFLLFIVAVGLAAIAEGRTRAISVDERIEQLISQMSLAEKVSMLGGTGFDTKPIARLGVPALRMTDGPLGVRSGPETAFPAGIALGASFDPALIQRVAAAMGEETRKIGRHVLLGPCVNISRQPFGGRNFESYGEDPFLTSQLAASYVRGLQSQNVLASVKHFALNDQEYERMTVDVHADLRTMFEIHFPAFKAAVDAGSWSVMTSYNQVNGIHSTENDFLQNAVLKGLWNFKGFIVSDWEATHSTVAAANAGLDLEMPFGAYFNDSLTEAVRRGAVSETTINDKIRRLLRPMFAIGIMGTTAPQIPAPLGPESRAHQTLALETAQKSIVLLKNEGSVLPLDPRHTKRVAIIGPSARILRVNGGGSSKVSPYRIITPLSALQTKARAHQVQLKFAEGRSLPGDVTAIASEFLSPEMSGRTHGLKAEYFQNRNLAGPPTLTRVDSEINFDFRSLGDHRFEENFSVRWTGYLSVPESGTYQLQTWSDDGVRLFVDGRSVIENWKDHGRELNEATLNLVAGQKYEIRLEYYQGGQDSVITFGWKAPGEQGFAAAVEAARTSDVALIFTGLGNDMESEGRDRDSMELPVGQKELILAVAAVNPKTVVILNSGNPLALGEWLPKVRGLVQAWYPGQEGGQALSDVLFGDVNPSGKLPITWLKRWEDSPAFGNYPGQDGRVDYKEGIFVGYRSFDQRKIEPVFPFGFGLSYSKFKFSDLQVTVLDPQHSSPRVRVQFKVQNMSARTGAEVAQLYVGEKNSPVPRPPRELKGFQKVALRAAESRVVSMELDLSAFASFDSDQMRWLARPSTFMIDVGASSRDLPLHQELKLQ